MNLNYVVLVLLQENVYFYIIRDFHVDNWPRVSLWLTVLLSDMKQCYLTFWTFSGLSEYGSLKKSGQIVRNYVFNKKEMYFL